jgi:hypothetical protein
MIGHGSPVRHRAANSWLPFPIIYVLFIVESAHRPAYFSQYKSVIHTPFQAVA